MLSSSPVSPFTAHLPAPARRRPGPRDSAPVSPSQPPSLLCFILSSSLYSLSFSLFFAYSTWPPLQKPPGRRSTRPRGMRLCCKRLRLEKQRCRFFSSLFFRRSLPLPLPLLPAPSSLLSCLSSSISCFGALDFACLLPSFFRDERGRAAPASSRNEAAVASGGNRHWGALSPEKKERKSAPPCRTRAANVLPPPNTSRSQKAKEQRENSAY